jgi:hypothetical protein
VGDGFEMHSKKKFVTLAECTQYVAKIGLSVSEMVVGSCFFESITMCADTVKGRRCEEMWPWEFVVFMCRITYEHYRTTSYHNESMYLKMDRLLPTWLVPIDILPTFSYKEEFNYDKKKARKQMLKAGMDISEHSSDEDSSSSDNADQGIQ